MSLHFTLPPLSTVTLTPEQAAILNLLERVEALERHGRYGGVGGDAVVMFKSVRGPSCNT